MSRKKEEITENSRFSIALLIIVVFGLWALGLHDFFKKKATKWSKNEATELVGSTSTNFVHKAIDASQGN